MLALKRIVTVAVMVYLLLAVLFFLFPAVRSSVAGLNGSGSLVDDERSFFHVLSIIGAVLLALQLVVENLDSTVLRRSAAKQDAKINELKARLYDTSSPAAPASAAAAHHPSVSYPTAAAAAAAAEREPLPATPPATPPTY